MDTSLIVSQDIYHDSVVRDRTDWKSAAEMLLAGAGLVFFSPVFLIIAIAIMIEGDGPIFYKQERVGYKGRKFILYKFRTMIVNAEKGNIPQLSQGKNDTRLTAVGRFLRSHHLDEFPQLWNVMIGEMSFVGHRPEREYFINKIIAVDPNYLLLYQARPGLFSRATLYNGYTYSMDKMLNRLEMDLEYLYTRSVKADAQIILLSFLFIILGKKF